MNTLYKKNYTFGKEVAIFRSSLDMTQQQFADAISSSRVTINKLEHIDDLESLSLDIAYRLFYITQKVRENAYLPVFVIENATSIQQKVERVILHSTQEDNNHTLQI